MLASKWDLSAFVSCSFLLLIFGIVFARPLAASLSILESFQGPCWGHFGNCFAEAAKLNKCTTISREMLVLNGGGHPFLHYVC